MVFVWFEEGVERKMGMTWAGTQVGVRGVEAGLRGWDAGGSEGQDKHHRRPHPRANGRVLTPCVQ